MADRLIYADKLKAHYAWWEGGSREMTMDEAKSDFDSIIDLQPTVDPIKHGRWVIEPDATIMHCDVCGWVFEYYGGLEEEWNNCPHCGAQMDGGEK